MGDLTQHSGIYRHFAARLHRRGVVADYDVLYIGNFLTDLSQFVDPFAGMSAKARVRDQIFKTEGIWAHGPSIGRPIVNAFLDDLLGVHGDEKKRIGALSHYLRFIALGMTQFVFADDVPNKTLAMVFPPGAADRIANTTDDLRFIHFLPAKDVATIFEKYFTQYYPHEHLDMPPIEMNRGNYVGGLYDRSRSSGLILYMDGYKQFMAEELITLQRDWRKIRNVPFTDMRSKELHIRLDKVLHPLEDYFYHSNFVEGLLAQEMLRTNQNLTQIDPPAVDGYVAGTMAADLPGYFRTATRTAANQSEAPAPAWIRKALRRLRFPVYDSAKPSANVSMPTAACIYTGGFAGEDIFHTIIGALESLQETLTRVQAARQSALGTAGPPKHQFAKQLVLYRALMDTEFRNLLAAKDRLKVAQQIHKTQLAAGHYATEVDRLVNAGFLNSAAGDAFKAAMALDQQFTDDHGSTIGIGEFLLAVLSEGQIAENASRKLQEKLDRRGASQPLSDDYLATDNGTSAELIGTHSLMSKDSGHSQPFHLEAQALGRFAAYLVAYIFLTAVNGPVAVGPLAFDRLLNQVIRFPTLFGWEMKVLTSYRRTGRDPEFEEVAIDPKQMTAALLSEDPATLNDRITKFHAKSDLEKKYRALEEHTT